jgi:predicted PurR-regulated permease PerM
MVTAERILMALLLGGIAIGCILVLRPFVPAILWAGILTFTTWPLYEWLRHHLRLGRGGTAALMVATVAVVVVLPLALAVPSGADDAKELQNVIQNALAGGLPPAPSWLSKVPLVGTTIEGLWNTWAADITAMVAFFKPYFGIVAEFSLTLLLGLANGVLLFLLALLIAFFFYAWGDELARTLSALLGRIAGARAPRLIEVTGATVRGVVYGILGTAIVQGILTSFGLWAAGVPRPWLLGIVAGALSVLPVGAPLVWIPASLWLLAEGHGWRGVLLLAYGLLFISGSDNVIRPYFIARGAQLPFLLTMLGVLGGALAFGLLGVFVGPVLLGVGMTLVTEWAHAPPAEAKPAPVGGATELVSAPHRRGLTVP